MHINSYHTLLPVSFLVILLIPKGIFVKILLLLGSIFQEMFTSMKVSSFIHNLYPLVHLLIPVQSLLHHLIFPYLWWYLSVFSLPHSLLCPSMFYHPLYLTSPFLVLYLPIYLISPHLLSLHLTTHLFLILYLISPHHLSMSLPLLLCHKLHHPNLPFLLYLPPFPQLHSHRPLLLWTTIPWLLDQRMAFLNPRMQPHMPIFLSLKCSVVPNPPRSAPFLSLTTPLQSLLPIKLQHNFLNGAQQWMMNLQHLRGKALGFWYLLLQLKI